MFNVLCISWVTHSSFLDIFSDVCFGLCDGWKPHGRNSIQGSRCYAHWCRRYFIAAKEICHCICIKGALLWLLPKAACFISNDSSLTEGKLKSSTVGSQVLMSAIRISWKRRFSGLAADWFHGMNVHVTVQVPQVHFGVSSSLVLIHFRHSEELLNMNEIWIVDGTDQGF